MRKENLDSLLYEIGTEDIKIPPDMVNRTMKEIRRDKGAIYILSFILSISFILSLVLINFMFFSRYNFASKIKIYFAITVFYNVIIILVIAFKNRISMHLNKFND